jgi:ornithine decarboxylase
VVAQSIIPELEETFSVAKLNALPYKTPFLYMDLGAVETAYKQFRHHLPDVHVHYAMKCNPDSQVLTRLHKAGCSFEIASYTELGLLARTGVVASDVIFSNPVKVPGQIRRAYRAGLRKFAFDSQAELDKIAENAPGSSVYVRMATREADSDVPSEGKFGVDTAQALGLMQYARLLGLEPYGIAFHVGSQMREAAAWDRAISDAGELMKELAETGIRIQMLDMGGGFPAHHGEVPELEVFAAQIKQSLESLPYVHK